MIVKSDVPHVRLNLATVLLQRDRFDEALPLLEELASFPEDLRYRACMSLGKAALGKESPEWNKIAREAFELAVTKAPGPKMRALVLAELGKAQIRMGNQDEARYTLQSALASDPLNPDAQKRLTALDLTQGQEAEVLIRCEELIGSGVLNSRLLGDRYLALALLGRHREARATEALDVFSPVLDPSPPTEWSATEAFNRSLQVEMENHPALRYERYGTASTLSWRIDNPHLQDRTPAFSALISLFQREIKQQMATISPTHLLGRAKPRRAVLHTWCVLAQASGFEEWHMHQSGWISGVYYIAVPDEVVHATDNRGCIEFGNPELSHIPRRIPGERKTLRPRPGRLLMFPSQAYHRTYPSSSDAWRMAVAFDLIPIYH